MLVNVLGTRESGWVQGMKWRQREEAPEIVVPDFPPEEVRQAHSCTDTLGRRRAAGASRHP